jgi:hypothetical protein
MEDIIKKIIQIDQNAYENKQSAERTIKRYEEQLQNIFEDLRWEILERAKEEVKSQDQAEVEDCNAMVWDLEIACEKDIKRVEIQFQQIYPVIKKELLMHILGEYSGEL